MDSDIAIVERAAFSARLKQSLLAAGLPGTPTRLTRAFNLRLVDDSVTVHGVRKWLVGEAIPTQARINTFASWLRISPHWLRYGGDVVEMETARRDCLLLSHDDMRILDDFHRLDAQKRELVTAMVEVLLANCPAQAQPEREPAAPDAFTAPMRAASQHG